jgi:uncharacterized protein HemY
MEASKADAQVALGTVLFLSDQIWNAARRSLERALELNADHTEGQLLYGRLLEALGYLAEGLAAKQRVLERIRRLRPCSCRSRSRTGTSGVTTT